MGDRTAKNALFTEFAAVGKALGSPTRLELLDILAQGPVASTSWPPPPRSGSAPVRRTCKHCAKPA